MEKHSPTMTQNHVKGGLAGASSRSMIDLTSFGPEI